MDLKSTQESRFMFRRVRVPYGLVQPQKYPVYRAAAASAPKLMLLQDWQTAE